MKRYGIVLVALLLLMGCTSNDKVKEDQKDYTPATTTLSGEEVEQKLQKLKVKIDLEEFHEDGTGTLGFSLEPKNFDDNLSLVFYYTNWKVSRVAIYEVNENLEGGFDDSYGYFIKDNKNYSFINYDSEDYCQMPIEGGSRGQE